MRPDAASESVFSSKVEWHSVAILFPPATKTTERARVYASDECSENEREREMNSETHDIPGKQERVARAGDRT